MYKRQVVDEGDGEADPHDRVAEEVGDQRAGVQTLSQLNRQVLMQE